MNKLIQAMEQFLLENGYVKVKGTGLQGKWKVPAHRSIYAGDVYFLKAAVDFELPYFEGLGNV